MGTLFFFPPLFVVLFTPLTLFELLPQSKLRDDHQPVESPKDRALHRQLHKDKNIKKKKKQHITK